jgi:prophage maintenance system killer protein
MSSTSTSVTTSTWPARRSTSRPRRCSTWPTSPWPSRRCTHPAATFAGIEFYPDLVTKARVLVTHLVKNHPLPDGNKRAAFLAMIEFLARNGQRFVAEDVDTAIDMMVRIAASKVDAAEVEDWIRRQLH